METSKNDKCKAFTSLEQSRKLAEILPIESADMYWKNGVSDKYIQCFTPFVINENATNVDFDYDIPCWSLAALLEQFEDTAGLAKDYGLWVCYNNRKSYCTKHYDNPVDACVEMILKLHESKML